MSNTNIMLEPSDIYRTLSASSAVTFTSVDLTTSCMSDAALANAAMVSLQLESFPASGVDKKSQVIEDL